MTKFRTIEIKQKGKEVRCICCNQVTIGESVCILCRSNPLYTIHSSYVKKLIK